MLTEKKIEKYKELLESIGYKIFKCDDEIINHLQKEVGRLVFLNTAHAREHLESEGMTVCDGVHELDKAARQQLHVIDDKKDLLEACEDFDIEVIDNESLSLGEIEGIKP